MKKTVFLLTNIPCPRLQKKINHAARVSAVTVIYWDRFSTQYPVSYPPNVVVIAVKTGNTHSEFWGRIFPYLRFAKEALSLLRQIEQVEILHVDFIDVLVLARIYTLFKRKVRIYYEIGDLSSYQLGNSKLLNRVVQTLEKWLINKIDILILSSPAFWDAYYRMIYSGERTVIENMPPSSVVRKSPLAKETQDLTVGFIGSLRYAEMLDRLIRVVAELRQKGCPIKVFLAGAGPDYEHFHKEAASKDFVEFYGPFDYEKDIEKLYRRIDLTFAVYDVRIRNVRYAIPNRFYESVIYGIPLMVAKGTYLAKYVKKLNVGYCVTYDSEKEYADVLMDVLEKKEKFLSINKSLRNINRDAFCYNQYEGKLDELYANKG